MNLKHKSFTILIIFSIFSSSFIHAQVKNPQGFFLNDWQPKTVVSPSYDNTVQPTNAATVTITVDAGNKLTKISKYVYGNNGVPWAGKMNTDATLMKNIKNLNPNILRWPGGNLSNEYFWDAVEGKGPTDLPPTRKVEALNAGRNTTNWAMTLDNYYDMLIKTNSTGCICINYSYARYGTSADPVANAAHYAANWVRFDKGRTKYWELGNENMGSWEAGYEIDVTLNKDKQPKIITGELYGRHCRVFIDSMKYAASQIKADIKIGVVAMESLVTYDPVMQNWNAGMMPQIIGKADFLIVHSYYTPYNENSTVATVINSAANTKSYKEYVLNDLKKYAKTDTLPVALTEWNIFAVGGKQAVSYINGIHATLVLGELIKNQFAEATRWDLMNGWGNGDDHGMFASSDEPGVTLRTPHAPFFYMYYFQKYFGDYLVSSTVTGTGSSNITTYASTFSSGQSGIVVVNKGTTAQTIDLKVNNQADTKSFYRYVLTGGTDNGSFSRKVYVNGTGPSRDGGGPDNYETLKSLGTCINGSIKFVAPPLSVTYLLVTGDNIPDLTGIKTEMNSSFNIFPNPAKGTLTINCPDFEFTKIDIINMAGQKVFTQNTDTPVQQTMQLNLKLKSGIYFVYLSQGKNQLSKKLIVQ